MVDPALKSDLVSENACLYHLHVVRKSNLPLLVADDGELEVAARDLIDILDPSLVRVNGVRAQTDELCAAPGELRLKLSESSKLGCADGGVVLGVREQDNPVVANELVEVNGTLGGLGLEVGSSATQTERLGASFRHVCCYAPCQLHTNSANMRGSGVGGAQLSYLRDVFFTLSWCFAGIW